MNANRIEVRIFPNVRALSGIPTSTTEEYHRTYSRWVERANELLQRLEHKDLPVPELRKLKLELSTALAAVRSHELFLAALGGRSGVPRNSLADMIRRDFGSVSALKAEIRSTALASRGWVALTYDHPLRKLMCVPGDTPEQLTFWNNSPVLVLDVSERQASGEFEGQRERYVDTLLDNVNWEVAERNLHDAISTQPAAAAH